MPQSGTNSTPATKLGERVEIEAVLPDLLKSLIRIAMRLRAAENRRREELRQRQEAAELRQREERRRQEEQARIMAEQKRRRELLRDAANLRRAHTLLELIAAVEDIAVSEGVNEGVLAEWLNHAQATAESLNPANRKSAARRLEQDELTTPPRAFLASRGGRRASDRGCYSQRAGLAREFR
jgi:hypothetical protein